MADGPEETVSPTPIWDSVVVDLGHPCETDARVESKDLSKPRVERDENQV